MVFSSRLARRLSLQPCSRSLEVPTAPLDDWLLLEPLNDASTEGPAPAALDLPEAPAAEEEEDLAEWVEREAFGYAAMFPEGLDDE